MISYGTLDSKAPQTLHRLFAIEAFLGGVTPWPASPETFELLPRLKPLGKYGGFTKTMPLGNLIDMVCELINANPLALLCARADCERCNTLRRTLSEL